MELKGSIGVVFVLDVTSSCVDLKFFWLEDNSFLPSNFSALVRPGSSLCDEKLDLRNLKKE